MVFVNWHKDDHSFHSKIIVTNEIFVKLHAYVNNMYFEKKQEEIVALFSSRSIPELGLGRLTQDSLKLGVVDSLSAGKSTTGNSIQESSTPLSPDFLGFITQDGLIERPDRTGSEDHGKSPSTIDCLRSPQ